MLAFASTGLISRLVAGLVLAVAAGLWLMLLVPMCVWVLLNLLRPGAPRQLPLPSPRRLLGAN